MAFPQMKVLQMDYYFHSNPSPKGGQIMGFGLRVGSDQVNLSISLFIHFKTLDLSLVYRFFGYRKSLYRATGTPEIQNLLPSSEHNDLRNASHLPFDSLDKRLASGCNTLYLRYFRTQKAIIDMFCALFLFTCSSNAWVEPTPDLAPISVN